MRTTIARQGRELGDKELVGLITVAGASVCAGKAEFVRFVEFDLDYCGKFRSVKDFKVDATGYIDYNSSPSCCEDWFLVAIKRQFTGLDAISSVLCVNFCDCY